MRSYKDIDTFSEWTSEEQYQFSLAVTKGLIMDMVRKANSGHSGGPMSSADFTQILFSKYLNFDPKDPEYDRKIRKKYSNLDHTVPDIQPRELLLLNEIC